MGWNVIFAVLTLLIASFLVVTALPNSGDNVNENNGQTSTEKYPTVSTGEEDATLIDRVNLKQYAWLSNAAMISKNKTVDGRQSDLVEIGAITYLKNKWMSFRYAMRNGLKEAWNHGRPVKILVHGYNWMDVDGLEARLGKLLDIAKAYQSMKTNVIIYDWYAYATESHGNTHWDYYNAYLSVPKVGRNLRQFLVDLQSSSTYRALSVNKDDLHIIGFDLGAHVGAYGSLDNKVATRVTGIEPAGPNLRKCNFIPSGRLGEYDSVDRLKSSMAEFDAHFVDAFHCNVGCQQRQNGRPEDEHHDSIDVGRFGSNANHGFIDIYVNDGMIQPECTNTTAYPSNKERGLCSHNQCLDVYKKTILDGNLKACRASFNVRTQKVEPNCNLGSASIGNFATKPKDGGLYHIAT